MIKYVMSIVLVVGITACQAQQISDSNAGYALQGLAEAAANTPYLAKVQHVDVVKERAVDPATQEKYQRHIYLAEVITTYRGKHAAEISYVVHAEEDEEALLDAAPVIVALCLDQLGQLYWPGTGSQFPANRQTETWLSKHQKTLVQQNSQHSWCEE